MFINLKIDTQEKFDFFKVTFKDISGFFDECHIKIRGAYSQECVDHVSVKFRNDVFFYQDLIETDWVEATLTMLGQVKARSIFIYFEDHRLVGGRQLLENTLLEFESNNLDYLCYSFFKSSKLGVENILPLGVSQRREFDVFSLNTKNTNLVGKISPFYYTFSLLSLCSVDYLHELLSVENKAFKINNKFINKLITRLFPYPKHRSVFHFFNKKLAFLGSRLCLYTPSSPFNVEKMWFETPFIENKNWQFGILKGELFANYDDDNGSYGESLIKKGFYPFNADASDTPELRTCAAHKLSLVQGESFDCTYYSHNERIRHAPVVKITVTNGRIAVDYLNNLLQLSAGEAQLFYSNKTPIIRCCESAEIEVKVFDEIFS
ncbi:hypothetical protein OAB91_00475 [Alphaproteobacteria bacterium]|nr:hypothetical protein [Alphaproteobacteria bacterium]